MGSPKIIAKRGWAAPGLRSLCKARDEGRGGRGFGSSPAILDRRRRGGDAHRGADSGFDSGWGAGGDEANGCTESGERVRERRSDSGRSESGPARRAKARQAKARRAKARRTEVGVTPPGPSAAAAPPLGLGGSGRFHLSGCPGRVRGGEGRQGRGNGGGEGKLGASPQPSRLALRANPSLRPPPPETRGIQSIRAVGPIRIGRRGP